jgi:hypothetical protein
MMGNWMFIPSFKRSSKSTKKHYLDFDGLEKPVKYCMVEYKRHHPLASLSAVLNGARSKT